MGPLPWGSGEGLCLSPENFETFSLEMAILVQISLYILTEMLGYLLLGPRQLLYFAAADGVLPLRPWSKIPLPLALPSLPFSLPFLSHPLPLEAGTL